MSNAVNDNLKERIAEELEALIENDEEFKQTFEEWVEKTFHPYKEYWESEVEKALDYLYEKLSNDYLEEVYYTGVKACALYIMENK